MYTLTLSLLTTNPAHGPASYHSSLDWLTDLGTTGIAWLTTCSPWGSIPVLGLLTCVPGSHACPVASCISHGLYSCCVALHVASQPHAHIKAPYLSWGSIPIPWPHEHPRALYMSHAAPFSLWVLAVRCLMPQTGMWLHDPGWILSLLLGSRMLITTGGAVVDNF